MKEKTKSSSLYRQRRLQEGIEAFLFLLPAGIIILTFHFLPIFYAFYLSLHRWTLVPERWVGLQNYWKILHDAEFWQSLGVTFWFVLGTVPPTLILSLLIALLLFQKMFARSLYRTLYFLPYVTSVVAAAMVWRWVYNPDYGILNYLLGKLGLPHLQWLMEPEGVFQLIAEPLHLSLPTWAKGPSLALVSIILMTIWSNLGFNIVVYLAGLTLVPRELQEAARIDGASESQVFFHVTLPLLSPTTFFLLIVGTIRAFQAFNQIYVMTQPTPGGPLGTTQTVTVYLFNTFYGSGEPNVGYGASIAFVLFVVIASLTLLQFRLARERVIYQ